jgi:uncharacterized protein
LSDAQLIERTAVEVRGLCEGESSGHDWWHVWRVWQMARRIGEREGAEIEIVELAALLHDVAGWKFSGDVAAGPRAARAWLERWNVAEPRIEHVERIIADLSFKGAGVPTPMHSLEGQAVQDADRLDAIGALGIARAFAYGGHRGRAMYDPEIPPERHDSFAAYRQNSGPTINHFYEKLLLLADRLNTATAREIAAERQAFMQQFLSRFFAEWEGS